MTLVGKDEVKSDVEYIDKLYGYKKNELMVFDQTTIYNAFMFRRDFGHRKIRFMLQAGAFSLYAHNRDFLFQRDTYFTNGNLFNTKTITNIIIDNSDFGAIGSVGVSYTYWNKKRVYLNINGAKGIGLIGGLNSNMMNIELSFDII